MVICSLTLSHQLGRTALQAAPLRNLCVLRVSALDFSSLGLTLNLQLSTFNRVSFLSPSSPHLCALCVLCGENSSPFRSSLIPRHSPLTTKSFTIRTSKTPLPQLLYNPHLQAPLGPAGNKGLITPLESALTRNSPVSPLESALTKRWGVGGIVLTSHRSPQCLGASVAIPSSVPAPDFAPWLFLLNFQSKIPTGSGLSTLGFPDFTVWLFRFNFQLSTVNFQSEIPTPSEPSTRYIVMPLKSLG